MSTYRGKYSGSGSNPIPAKGSFMQDSVQDTAKQKQPDHPDFAGALSDKRKPVDGDLTSSGGNNKGKTRGPF